MQFSMESGKRAVLVMNLNISMEYSSFPRGDPRVRSSGSTTIDGGGWQAQVGLALGPRPRSRLRAVCCAGILSASFRLSATSRNGPNPISR